MSSSVLYIPIEYQLKEALAQVKDLLGNYPCHIVGGLDYCHPGCQYCDKKRIFDELCKSIDSVVMKDLICKRF